MEATRKLAPHLNVSGKLLEKVLQKNRYLTALMIDYKIDLKNDKVNII